MKKRVLSLITVLAMTVAMLAGCGGSSDKASADTKTDAESTTTEVLRGSMRAGRRRLQLHLRRQLRT